MSRKKPVAPQIGRFALLPRDLIKHPVVTSLSPAVRWLLVALADQWTGHNNGALMLTPPMAAQYGITSRDTFTRGVRELATKGLIRITYHGSQRPPKPRRFAVTWQPINETDFTAPVAKAPMDFCRIWAAQGKAA